MKDYERIVATLQQLRIQIGELEAEVNLLKEQEKKEELPRNFNVDAVMTVIHKWKNKEIIADWEVSKMFIWVDTSQGDSHWREISDKHKSLTSEDIIYLQGLVILYYQKK